MHDAPLFLGLTRPPKIFGLPIGYFVSLMLGSVIPFVGANDWRFLLIGVIGYPVLWFVADRNPNLFETVAVVFSRTPRTRGTTARSSAAPGCVVGSRPSPRPSPLCRRA